MSSMTLRLCQSKSAPKICNARRLARLFSSSSSHSNSTPTTSQPTRKQHKQPPRLPPSKLRALITLYHQSETFVTPDTLSSRIEWAFAHPCLPSALPSNPQAQFDYQDLRDIVARRRNLPRMCDVDELGNLNDDMSTTSGSAGGLLGGPGADMGINMWSDMKTPREQRIVDALYGVDVSPRHVMPGLEVLEEEAGRIFEDIQKQQQRAKEW